MIPFILTFTINYQVGYSADVLYSVCNNYGGQEALLIGKIVEVTYKKRIMKVEIVRLVSGTLKYINNKISIQLEKLDIGDEPLK